MTDRSQQRNGNGGYRSDDEYHSSAEIQHEIEMTRRDMAETIDAIQRKLSPQQVWDQVLDSARDGLSANSGRLADTARQHPAPLAMIALGAVWMWLSTQPGYDRRVEQARMRARGYAGRARDSMSRMGESMSHLADSARGTVGAAGERISGAAAGARDRVSHATERARDSMSHAADRTRESASYATERARESASHAAERARETASHAADRSREGMEGATERARSAAGYGRSRYEAQGDYPHYGSRHDYGHEEHHEGRMRRMGQRMSDAGHRMTDATGRAYEGVRDYSGRAYEGARYAGETIGHSMRENPIAFGILGFAIGAAIGALLPSTEVEDEWMGDYADDVREQARETGHEAMDKATHVAARAADAAGQVVAEETGVSEAKPSEARRS